MRHVAFLMLAAALAGAAAGGTQAGADVKWPRVEVTVSGTFTVVEEADLLQVQAGLCPRRIRWRTSMTGSFTGEKPVRVSLGRLTSGGSGLVTIVGAARRAGEFTDSYAAPCVQGDTQFDTTGCEGPWPMRMPAKRVEIGFRQTLFLVGSSNLFASQKCFFFGVPGVEDITLPLVASGLTLQQALARRSSSAVGRIHETESLPPRFPDSTGTTTRTIDARWTVRLVRL